MSRPYVAPCESCGLPVRWVRTVRGELLPIDPDPDPEGYVLLTDSGAVTFGRQMTLDPALEDGIVLFMPHIVSCPDVESIR